VDDVMIFYVSNDSFSQRTGSGSYQDAAVRGTVSTSRAWALMA
jgi:hypothetical protein